MTEGTENQLYSHLISSLPWYVVRASGLIAAVLLVVLIVSGIGLITGLTFRYWPPIKAWAIHKAIGISLIISISCHILFLLFDQYAKYSLANILLPFTKSLWVTLGVLAMYFLIVLIYTSLTIIESKKQTWKILHLLAYPTIVFIFFHALNLGTDLKTGILRLVWLTFGALITILIVTRLGRALWYVKAVEK